MVSAFTLTIALDAPKDPHYLLNCIQFSRTQAGIREITFSLDGVATSLMANRSYCSGVKVCTGEGCTYSVSTKQRVNHCIDHKSMALIPSGHVHVILLFIQRMQWKMGGGGLLC